jgi:hypothetical protein
LCLLYEDMPLGVGVGREGWGGVEEWWVEIVGGAEELGEREGVTWLSGTMVPRSFLQEDATRRRGWMGRAG